MKKFGSLLLVVAFMGSMAFADFSRDDLLSATRLAIGEFERDNPGHVEHFIGYKTWKSNGDAKVKIYVNHGGASMEFDYFCFKDEAEIQCSAQ